ncbi:uncharacterized protein METZ01_LOCUS237664 [marine metagenome]|uniref:Uncharacterized protein n=1 Tax=marine metagenome TaxID=408172 RepID=A0A382HC10_9ZZZZ
MPDTSDHWERVFVRQEGLVDFWLVASR